MGKARIAVAPGTHLRLDMTSAKPQLSVFSGQASLISDGAAAPTLVEKKHSLTLEKSGEAQTEVAKGIDDLPFDGWDKDAVSYHQRYMKTGKNFGSTAPLYGVSDLNYYGSFVNACGSSFWQPYLVSANWNPYSNGLWTLYSTGYSWVSPYPWGWLPYHTGSWNYCPGTGWGWRPGGSFYGTQNVALMNMVPAGGGVVAAGGPRDIVHPPAAAGALRTLRPPTGSRSIVVESQTPIVRSTMDRPDNFVFRKDSAGMGVPRGELGGLNHISHDVDRHGFANREVYAESTASARSMMRRGPEGQPGQPGGVGAPMALHRGPMPEGMGQGDGGRFGWKNGGPQQSANGTQTQGTQRPMNNAPGNFGGQQHAGWQGGGGGGQQHGGWQGGGNSGGGGFNRSGGGMPAGGGPPQGGGSNGGGRSGAAASSAPH